MTLADPAVDAAVDVPAYGKPAVTYPARHNPESGLTITRHFTTADGGPFADLAFTDRYVEIVDPGSGETKFAATVEVPDTWSQMATTIFASKFLRKEGVPQYDTDDEPITDADGEPVLGPERSVRQAALRLANAWMLWGSARGYFASEGDAVAYRDEMAHMIATQRFSPNSPQWFNTGVFEAYGIIEDAEGNWYLDPETDQVRRSEHKYERSAASACYISSIRDELVSDDDMGITGLITREARLFKAGSGSGTNFSPVRAEGEGLAGGGSASGVMSFLRPLDVSAGSIKSGGRTRRAAKMVILDADHPDIEAFIWAKAVEEEKIPALVEAGYSLDWNDPDNAYAQVFYQNANFSVRLPHEFMRAVDRELDWHLSGRRDQSVDRTVEATKLWHDIADAAWRSADPGVQYDGTIQEWATAPNDGRITGTNPCGEYIHNDDTSCNLASFNLVKFLRADGTFDTEAFAHAARLGTITLEVTVAMSHYPSPEVARNSAEHRTLGLGYTNIGALLMRSGLPYDSPEGRAVMGGLTALLHQHAYGTSAEMAGRLGTCEAYERNTEPLQKVVRNHVRAALGTRRDRRDAYEELTVDPVGVDHDLLAQTPLAGISDEIVEVANRTGEQVATHGVRNMQVTVLAPTGTIGLQMDSDTTGVEPDFSLVKYKKLAGGGTLRIVNESVRPALRVLGYDEGTIEQIAAYVVGTSTLAGGTPVNAESLRAAGMSQTAIDAAENALASAFSFAGVFTPAVIGDGPGAAGDAVSGDEVLRSYGFSDAQIAETAEVVLGRGHLEGCPQLDAAHLPIFDTAVTPMGGTRSIAWQGHVNALGAIAAHLSGSASKTVNMPAEATVEDIAEAYRLAYDLGVKAVSVYRDGSKGSQVLNTGASKAAKTEDEEESAQLSEKAQRILDAVSGQLADGESPKSVYNGSFSPPKFRLPASRQARVEKISIGGHDLFLTVGEYPDGTPGEIFLDLSKEGSTLKAVFTGFAMMTSLALQRGVPLAEIVEKFRGHTFEPSGMVIGHPNLKFASSPFDAVARILGYRYLGWSELVQVPDEPTAAAPAAQPADPAPSLDDGTPSSSAESMTGEISSCCGQPLLKTGTCDTCTGCGSTSGCG